MNASIINLDSSLTMKKIFKDQNFYTKFIARICIISYIDHMKSFRIYTGCSVKKKS